MMSRSKTAPLRSATLAALGLLAGCEEPQPISFAEFMDDDIAREGTLARCNEYRDETAADIECANARRAAAAIALRDERARREALEQESERKLAQLREQVERERAAAREAQLLAEEARRAAYDAQWESTDAPPVGIDGEPLQPVSPQPPSQAIGIDGLPISDAPAADAPSAGATALQEPAAGEPPPAPQPERSGEAIRVLQ